MLVEKVRRPGTLHFTCSNVDDYRCAVRTQAYHFVYCGIHVIHTPNQDTEALPSPGCPTAELRELTPDGGVTHSPNLLSILVVVLIRDNLKTIVASRYGLHVIPVYETPPVGKQC